MVKFSSPVFMILMLSVIIFCFCLMTSVWLVENQPAAIICEVKKRDVRLAVLVLSSMKANERRNVIRETWMKKYRERTSEVFVKFSVGTEGLSSDEIRKLTMENFKYDDLLLLPNLYDSYNNLTRKVLQSFVSIDNHYNFSHLLKCDDDSFIVLDTILRELKQRKSKQNYYWGYHYKKPVVRRHGKWAEKNWFLCGTYLPYAAGGGYILTQDLVRRIAASSNDLVLYNNEDVSIGTWLSPYKVERRHDERFNTYPDSSNCYNDQIILAERNTKDMYDMQKHLDRWQRLCPLKTWGRKDREN